MFPTNTTFLLPLLLAVTLSAQLLQDIYTLTNPLLLGVSAFSASSLPTKRRIRTVHYLFQSQPKGLEATTTTCLLAASVADTDETTTTSSSFISPMYQCYIEDTDSYGVMYNANYLRSFDRALHALHSFYAMGDKVSVLTASNNASGDDDDLEQAKQSMLDTHEDWAIVQVDNQKFKSSPKLGGAYCVHGTLVEHQDDLEVWDLSMHKSEDSQSTVFNSARVTIARPGVFAAPTEIVADGVSDGTAMTKDIFRLFRDEFDSHVPQHLPLRNVLTLFERSRSNYLGGPEALRQLQEKDRLLFVVTKVNNCCKFATDEDHALKPGKLVLVQTTFQVKRKGMIIECHQTLKANNRPVAQATVSLMTLNADTFKPSTNLPAWLKELLEGQ